MRIFDFVPTQELTNMHRELYRASLQIGLESLLESKLNKTNGH